MAKKRSRSRAARGSFARPMTLFLPAATGAVGALVVNGMVNYLPLPDALKAGRAIYLTRAALAVLLGLFGRRLPVIGPYATQLASGALVVTLADLGKDLAFQSGFNLSGTGYIGPARVVSLSGPGRVAGAGAVFNRMGAVVRPFA